MRALLCILLFAGAMAQGNPQMGDISFEWQEVRMSGNLTDNFQLKMYFLHRKEKACSPRLKEIYKKLTNRCFYNSLLLQIRPGQNLMVKINDWMERG